jgi:hypothetical protein
MGACTLSRLAGCRAGGGGDRGTFAPASATSRIGWRVRIHGWRAQAAGDGNLVTAVLVANNNMCPKAGIDTALIQSEKILPRDGWISVGARAIFNNTGPGGCRIGDSTVAR